MYLYVDTGYIHVARLVEKSFKANYWFLEPFHCLKTLDTIGNCDRLVFTVGVSQQCIIMNLRKFELNQSLKLRDNNEIKNTPVTRSCVLSDA